MTDFNVFQEISNKPIINTDIEYIVQQIELLFNTDTQSVLGDIDYGSDYDRYVFNIGVSNTALETKILGDLTKLDLLTYTPTVEVTFVEGTVRDIAMIDITLTEGSEKNVVYNKTFMIK